jgi:hypothetical protein
MNIETPNSLKIVGREYEVVKLQEYEDQVGGVDFESSVISLRAGQQKLLECDTLIHEAVHVIDEIFQLELTERQVFCTVAGLVALFRDNPTLFAYMHDALQSPRKV